MEEARREATQSDLLAYVRSLPEQQMAALTSEITDDVLDGMKKLVYSIMKGMGTSSVEANTLLQQAAGDGPALHVAARDRLQPGGVGGEERV